MHRLIAFTLCLVCFWVGVVTAKKPVKASAAISMAANDWTTLARGVPLHPTQVGAGWSIAFPTFNGSVEDCGAAGNCPSLNYLTTTNTPSLSAKSLLTMAYTISVTGAPVFNGRLEPWNTCPEPASVRLLIQKAGDWSTDYGRWWSNPLHMELAEGYAELSVPLIPDQWTSVYGGRADSSQAALSAWQALVNQPGAIGMTYGGGCFFGHGVLVQGGTATMTVTSFRAV